MTKCYTASESRATQFEREYKAPYRYYPRKRRWWKRKARQLRRRALQRELEKYLTSVVNPGNVIRGDN